jgi:hypothetical protein
VKVTVGAGPNAGTELAFERHIALLEELLEATDHLRRLEQEFGDAPWAIDREWEALLDAYERTEALYSEYVRALDEWRTSYRD